MTERRHWGLAWFSLALTALTVVLALWLASFPYHISESDSELLGWLVGAFVITGISAVVSAIAYFVVTDKTRRGRTGLAVGLAFLLILATPFLAPSFVHSVVTRRNVCYNQQRIIESTQDQIAFLRGLTKGTPLQSSAIAEHIEGNTIPKCPSGGDYRFGTVGQPVECSLHGSIENPKNRDKY